MNTSCSGLGAFAALLFFNCLAVSLAHAQQETEQDARPQESLAEIDRKLNNPLTSLWSLTLQDNIGVNNGDLVDGNEISNVLLFQPALPVPVGEKLVFIARPVFPLVTQPVLDPSSEGGTSGTTTGFGDIQLLSSLGPSRDDGWVWGVGVTFKFPTATDDALGQGKYQAGPAAMLFHMGRPWVLGTFVQHWSSFAGDDDRPDTDRTDIQYIVRYALPNAWSIGAGPTITINWEAESENRWTVPVGLGVTKTVRWGKMPVKLRAEFHYSVIRPESYGEEWNFRLQITPVIPSPFR